MRLSRPVMALIATGTAVITLGLFAMPASADRVRREEWWLSSLGISDAWAATQGAGVTVAVLSDGVSGSQPDVAGSVTTAPPLTGAPTATGQYFGQQGTAIASLIAGHGHGSTGSSGIIGVAPEARILSIAVTLPADDPQLGQPAVATAIPAAIAAGIRYAVSHGASVIDLPIDPGQPGSTGTGGAAAAAGGSGAEQQAVKYALKHGVVLVAPAGDDGAASDAPNYPAAYSGVIAVGAFDSAFNRAPWSSHQSYVTLTASGVGVRAAAASGGYQTVNSTSAASAIVSGVVALIRSRYPHLSVTQIRQALITTTLYRHADGGTNGSGYGAVDADKALAAAALLATGPSERAGARAQPLTRPASVPAASSTQGLGSALVRAGETSGAVLVGLLLLVAIYALVMRRRRKQPSQPAAAWTPRQAQSRYPQVSGVDADKMLEFFSTPVAKPQDLAGQPDRVPALLARTDQGVFARPAERTASPVGQPAAADTDTGRLPALGPASRAVHGRPAVSGRPPWEAASAPDGELPWSAGVVHDAAGAELPGLGTVPGATGVGETPAAETSGGLAASGLPVRATAPASQRWQSGGTGGRSLFQPAQADTAQPAEFDGRRPAGASPGDTAQSTVSDWAARAPAEAGGAAHWGTPTAADGSGGWHGRHSGSPVQQEPPWQEAPWQEAPWQESPWQEAPWQESAQHEASFHEAWQPESQQPDQAQPRIAESGLPIRPTRSATPAPLSPSGSLWEPIESEQGSYSSDRHGTGSRPIYVWNPVRTQPPTEDSGTDPAD